MYILRTEVLCPSFRNFLQ